MSSYYDNLNMDVKTMPERLREYYEPGDFVIVMNIDTKPFSYICQREENIRIHQPTSVTKELYYDKDPDNITLAPGETRLCPAYEADIMIKQLIDTIVLANRAKVAAGGSNPTESAMDPSVQHKYIKQIFQGKRDFMNEYNQQLSKDSDSRTQAEKDLEDAPVEPTVRRGPGRPKAETTPA